MGFILAKYNTALTFEAPMIKRGVVDQAVSADWTPATGDVKVHKDGGAAANIGTLPTAIASGNGATWQFVLTSTEMAAARVIVSVADSATKAVEDNQFIILTYGHASAHIVADLSVAIGTSTLTQTQVTGGAYALQTDASGYVKSSSGTGTGQISLSSGAVLLQPTQTGVTIPTVTTVGTATNLTNAPTAGDFTATMKTSIGTAVAASAVASVTAPVTVGTNNDKSGYSISGTTTTLDALQTALNSAHGGGSWATATGFSTHSAADVWAVATRVLTAGTNIVLPSNALGSVTAWTVAITGNITGNLSGSVGSVTGLTVSNLDATVSGRASQSSVDTLTAYVDTEVAAIKVKTDQLTFTVANKVDATATVSVDTAAVADAVWDEALSGHSTTGSAGAKLTAAGNASDPWSAASRTLTSTGTVVAVGPVATGGTAEIVQGDTYTAAAAGVLDWSSTSWPDITTATIALRLSKKGKATYVFGKAGTVVNGGAATQTARFELTAAETAALDSGVYDLQIVATISTAPFTLVLTTLTVRSRVPAS